MDPRSRKAKTICFSYSLCLAGFSARAGPRSLPNGPGLEDAT